MEKQKPDIKKLASCAKISLTQEEYAAFAHNFDDILSFLDSIVETVYSAPADSEVADYLREDEPCTEYHRDELLFGAVTNADGYIIVPQVMEEI